MLKFSNVNYEYNNILSNNAVTGHSCRWLHYYVYVIQELQFIYIKPAATPVLKATNFSVSLIYILPVLF